MTDLVKSDGSFRIKKGSTEPLKWQLRDEDGNPMAIGASPTLSMKLKDLNTNATKTLTPTLDDQANAIIKLTPGANDFNTVTTYHFYFTIEDGGVTYNSPRDGYYVGEVESDLS